ncbi:MAG: hypothetical protein ACREEG_08265, partial [Phenylobacterium sp.]
MVYQYFELGLGRERTAQQTLAKSVYGSLGDKAVAVFAPVLGFASDQALVLVDGEASADAVLKGAGVVSAQRQRLTPTIRPKAGAQPMAGGVYVHNWFTIDGSGFDEFVKLSGDAWPDFEEKFDARILGLFSAEASPDDLQQGQRRLLLMTRYKDLGEWQKSRDPTTEAMKIFARRRELTRVSLARSCVLM